MLKMKKENLINLNQILYVTFNLNINYDNKQKIIPILTLDVLNSAKII